jgi:putative restriction endonuclease
MARLEKLSNISWKQPFKDRKKEFHLFTAHTDVSNHCQLEDGTKRLLNIKFEDNFNIDITDNFQITSGREISFPKELQELIKPIILDNPNSFFIITVLDNTNSNDNKKLLEEYLTTGSATISTRIGQDKFRKSLIEYWDKKCAISNIDIEQILKASHIKPWKASDDQERLDPYNGLLLNPMLDELFDKGYITFSDDGLIEISKEITDPTQFAINENLKLKKVEDNHKKYLQYHRENVFRKS